MSFKGPMVDLEMNDEDVVDTYPSMPSRPKGPVYPYGTRISFCEKEMEKLDLEMPSVGDTIDLRAFGVVTSVSASDGEYGSSCRVEIQLQKMRVENEDTEEE
jgi:hypothetical protein